MIDLSTASLVNVSIHYVGNKGLDQKLVLSENSFNPGEGLTEKLEKFFLNKFSQAHERFKFHHPSSLKFNEVFSYIDNVFADNDGFHDGSVSIARHLFESSSHPKIKPGELYVCLFRNCDIDERVVDAIGIFKTEVKNGYFDVRREKRDFTLTYQEGIDSNKFEKGCLVFNINPEDGYEVSLIDNNSRGGEEAQYWMNTFMGLSQISNEFHQTNHFLNLTKEFISERLTEEFEVEKTDQIALLNKSVEYFRKHETFDKQEFETEVFGQEDIIESFRNYDGEYRQNYDVELEESFAISTPAVKKQARVFKSVLKLDKNFHIYIHGDKDKIEKGVDEDGRKFYKIYYEDEE